MIRVSLCALAVCLLSTVAVDAQSGSRIVTEQPANGARQEGSVRVQSTVNMFMPGPTGNSEQATALREKARRAVYEMAARECVLLREVMAKDCRLETVNVGLNNRQFGQQQTDGYQVNGSMSLQITLK